ncbi:MAG: response regulator [Xenococcaceae cyanobacterium MO_167.B27]|nr:response regulator [Xenococcaceae cyanobacterium MO_167.B27]
MIRILLVDDQHLLCEVLKTWLEVEEDFQVVGVAYDGEEGLKKVEMLQPDVVLMDIDMPGMDGLSATRHICDRFPDVKVIFLSGHDDDNYLGKSLRAGAKGYLLKNTTAEELAAKIRFVYENNNNHNSNNFLPESEHQDLGVFQAQLEDFIEIYRDKFQKQLENYQQSIAEINNTSNVDSSYEKRLEKLENLLRETKEQKLPQVKQEHIASLESVRNEISNVHSQLSNANQALSSQVNQQIFNLKHELDNQLKTALDDWSRQRASLQEWAVQRDEMHISPEEFEDKYRQELVSWVNPIRASLRNSDKQIKTLRNWLIVVSLLAGISLGFSSWILVAHVMGENSQSSQVNQSGE